MKKKIFDDIYLWSRTYIKSIKLKKLLKGDFIDLNIIVKSIIEDIKKNKYNNKVLLINDTMKIHNNFMKMWNVYKYTKEFQVLQVGSGLYSIFTELNKINNIGAFIIDIKNTDLDKFELDSKNGYPNKIYDSGIGYFVHQNELNRYIKMGNYKVLNQYNSEIEKVLRINHLNLINYKSEDETNKDKDNPFWFIKQIKTSKSLIKFEKRVKEVYKLQDYSNNTLPTLLFGLYNPKDFEVLDNHKGQKFILWGGSDADYTQENHKWLIKRAKHTKVNGHYAISENLEKRLKSFGFRPKLINFNLTDLTLFKPSKVIGKHIYIYNGSYDGRENIYGEKEYKEVIKRLPEFKYVFSSKLQISYEQMPKVYEQCFIGLRLTKYDGNANTVQEMGAMNIPVIHNSSEKNALSWRNVDDIELKIRYRNIDLFNNSIKKYKKILFICSDYPGYGGAATNTVKLMDYYKGQKKIIEGIFYTNDDVLIKNSRKDIHIVKVHELKKKLKTLSKKKYDLVILRNYITFSMKEFFDCPIYFFIPGIFEPFLNKHYYKIKSKEEMNNFIQKNILLTIKYSSKSFCASYHTRMILKKFYNLDTEILYFNYMHYYGKIIPSFNDYDKRKYDYGVIVSNFGRIIKNIEGLIEQLKNTNKKVILIGRSSNMYRNDNFTCIDLVSHDEVLKYMKDIKVLLQDSFYESHSNVFVEGRFNGCKVEKNVKPKDIINKIIPKEILNNVSTKFSKLSSDIINKNIDRSKKREDIKILVTSTQYPYYGGAATCAYHSISYLRNLGFKVFGVFFENKRDIDVDPDKYGDVIRMDIRIGYRLKKQALMSQLKTHVLNYFGDYPDMIFGWNYGAPIISRSVFPNTKLVYVMTGIPTVTIGDNSPVDNDMSIIKVMKEERVDILSQELFRVERECIELSDISLPYTKLIENFFQFAYPDLINKLYPFFNTAISNVVDHTKIYTEKKEYDLMGLSSNWYRKVKNLKLLLDIYENYPDSKKVIVGLSENKDVSDNFKELYQRAKNMKNLTLYPLIPYDEAQQIVAKSRILLVTSYSESGPNVVIEAFLQKCQVVTSKNIGFFSYLNPFNVCEDVYNVNEYYERIDYILNNFDKLPIPDLSKFMESEDNQQIDFIYNNLIDKSDDINIVFITCDIPNIGGAATNTYNMIKTFKGTNIKCHGIFISNIEGEKDPDNVGNIHILKVDDDMDSNFTKIFNQIDKKNNIDLVFYKNYKVFVYTNHLIKNKFKIFSPSGLRYLTNQISKQKKWFKNYNLKKINLIPELTEIPDISDIKKFIRKYDSYLEDYVFKECDLIVPNSFLTHSIIKSTKRFNYKLNDAIHLTNINFEMKKKLLNFKKRKYDYVFIAHNWKRQCKNYDLVKKLCKRDELKDFKKVIIGHNQSEIFNNDKNIITHEFLGKEELYNLLSETRNIIIPSFYDSNPNLLIEAASYGCNIICSYNIGNSVFVNNNCIVSKYDDIKDWIRVILNCKKSYSFKGYTKTMVTKDLKELFYSCINGLNRLDSIEMDAIGIYKVPAKWDIIENYNNMFNKPIYYKETSMNSFYEHATRKTDISKNIYFVLFEKIVKEKKFKHSHYIFVDEFRNSCSKFKINNITVWVLNKPENVLFFNKAKFYFLRGNYHKFYKNIINKDSFNIHYGATSVKYDYNINISQKIRKCNLEAMYRKNNLLPNYQVALVHEDNIYRDIYSESNLINLEKFSSSDFYYTNMKRLYSVIFVADATQTTKNHILFMEFLNFCEDNGFKLNVAYVTNKDILKKKCPNFVDYKNFKNIIIHFFKDKTPKELNLLYNQSRINLILSGRDACPRVISESLACGCFNIALDTLSDGKFYYTGIFGKLLSFKEATIECSKSTSLSYVGETDIYITLLKYIYNNNYDHKSISDESLKKYNVDVFVKKLIPYINI